VLAEAAARLDVKGDGGLNIEALELDGDPQRLLIGFRSPLLERRALIARVDNLAAMFEANAPPAVSPALIALDLGGDGLRAMAWLPALDGYLLVSGPVGRTPVAFRLWFWNGRADAPARAVSVPGLEGFERTEGISAARLGTLDRIILVSDDGDRDAGRDARYALLDPAQLRIAP
jgi:hypothetical protein